MVLAEHGNLRGRGRDDHWVRRVLISRAPNSAEGTNGCVTEAAEHGRLTTSPPMRPNRAVELFG